MNLIRHYTKFETFMSYILPTGGTEVLVYNKEFRDRNFSEGSIRGIFTLAEATKDEVDFIEEKSSELKIEKGILKQRKKVLENKIREKDKLEDDFKLPVTLARFERLVK